LGHCTATAEHFVTIWISGAARLRSLCRPASECVQFEVQPDTNPSLPDDSEPDRYRLDPSRFPRRLELDLDPDALRQLEALAERSGRDLSEVAADLFSRMMRDLPSEH
jgi:hypothetical protein